jgi:endonuclease/exonuclease/phosphatase family metal-dependent hydrolase
MKKTIALAIIWLLLLFNLAAVPQPVVGDDSSSYLKLASWNIRIFSNSRSDDELRMICRVAKNFDFITIMELRDEQVLQRMVSLLRNEFGRSYAYQLSPYLGEMDPAKDSRYLDALGEERVYHEMCAFLYDSSFIQCVAAGKIYDDSTFFRKPYYANFRARNFDFTIIGIHVIWGDTVEERRKEIKRLADVYRVIQDGDTKENDVILVGDFNRNPDDDLAWGPLRSISSMINLFNLPEKSMIWDTNLYDNIWFQSAYASEYTLDHAIVRFDETDFNNDDDAANLAVSDHRPVWALFRTDTDDD